MSNLFSLNLSENKIHKLCNLPQSLNVLYAFGNEIDQFEGNYHHLIHLGIGVNVCTTNCLEEIIQIFPNLLSLDISYNKLEDLNSVLELLKSLPLRSLNLMGNPCCYIPFYTTRILKELPNLEFLDDTRYLEDDPIRNQEINPNMQLQISIEFQEAVELPGPYFIEEDPKKKKKAKKPPPKKGKNSKTPTHDEEDLPPPIIPHYAVKFTFDDSLNGITPYIQNQPALNFNFKYQHEFACTNFLKNVILNEGMLFELCQILPPPPTPEELAAIQAQLKKSKAPAKSKTPSKSKKGKGGKEEKEPEPEPEVPKAPPPDATIMTKLYIPCNQILDIKDEPVIVKGELPIPIEYEEKIEDENTGEITTHKREPKVNYTITLQYIDITVPIEPVEEEEDPKKKGKGKNAKKSIAKKTKK